MMEEALDWPEDGRKCAGVLSESPPFSSNWRAMTSSKLYHNTNPPFMLGRMAVSWNNLEASEVLKFSHDRSPPYLRISRGMYIMVSDIRGYEKWQVSVAICRVSLFPPSIPFAARHITLSANLPLSVMLWAILKGFWRPFGFFRHFISLPQLPHLTILSLVLTVSSLHYLLPGPTWVLRPIVVSLLCILFFS